ncbi:MlaC/ttg2D family ABC transporter substrate-binding protein [Sideroxydans lithotrophicus]|uniref:Toluene tolerance family protein n=1 Tax=Sideroxydans lithotrophicus (strain ES-1) TaxID=580332 RepID=D5CNL9_SIDLE|nr:ABC transporter substrate-binding protein [Sideroxydans lithotrophicus]ADE10932.1 toluene tolerance family protein [Sideroxydans lithotrophicus ES-1]
MKKILVLLSGVILLNLSLGARADVPDPDALIRNTVDEVLNIVRKDKDLRSGNQKKMLELVDAKVLPHFNFEHMTKLAVGRAWRTATPEQKKALMNEFRIMLVRTYTKAFTSYRDQVVEIKPFKLESGATDVTVKTSIVKPGSQQPILVDYDMEKSPDGWKVYDLTVEGVSLVTSYRGTFADQIQQVGIDGLIKTLVEKNQSAANNAALAEKSGSK